MGVPVRVRPEAVLASILVYPAVRVGIAIGSQRASAGQDTAVGQVKPQGVDYGVQLGLEILGPEFLLVVEPGGVEPIAGATHVAAQVADAAGRSHEVGVPAVAVQALGLGHGSDGEIHSRIPPALCRGYKNPEPPPGPP